MIAIGIDVGGTSIKGAAVDNTGKVYDVFTLSVNAGLTGEFVMEQLGTLINEYIQQQGLEGNVLGVGLGVPGIINSEEGIVEYSANLPLWEKLNIKKILEEKTGLPVKITNDANAAALGEAKLGAGKDYPTSIMITLGTGVGGGIVLDGKLFEGNEGKGAELGHITLVLNGRRCGCGRRGCFEQYASATGLIHDTTRAMNKHPESLMHKLAEEYGEINAKVPFEAEKLGDETAHEVIETYITYLGEGLLNYCNIFRPQMIIICGGIAKQGQPFIDRVQKYLADHNYGYKRTPEVKVSLAKFGYDSGKIGAAALFFE